MLHTSGDNKFTYLLVGGVSEVSENDANVVSSTVLPCVNNPAEANIASLKAEVIGDTGEIS